MSGRAVQWVRVGAATERGPGQNKPAVGGVAPGEALRPEKSLHDAPSGRTPRASSSDGGSGTAGFESFALAASAMPLGEMGT